MDCYVTFFLDEKSNQKNQDLDLFAKKITTCLKILNLRESTLRGVSSVVVALRTEEFS
jgi:hypothetical protein